MRDRRKWFGLLAMYVQLYISKTMYLTLLHSKIFARSANQYFSVCFNTMYILQHFQQFWTESYNFALYNVTRG